MRKWLGVLLAFVLALSCVSFSACSTKPTKAEPVKLSTESLVIASQAADYPSVEYTVDRITRDEEIPIGMTP